MRGRVSMNNITCDFHIPFDCAHCPKTGDKCIGKVRYFNDFCPECKNTGAIVFAPQKPEDYEATPKILIYCSCPIGQAMKEKGK